MPKFTVTLVVQVTIDIDAATGADAQEAACDYATDMTFLPRAEGEPTVRLDHVGMIKKVEEIE
jgi:hypothetical protein